MAAKKAYIVTFDSNEPIGQTILSAYPGSMQVTPSSYVLASDQDPRDIVRRVEPELGYHKIYAVALECPYFGCGPEDLNQWFTDNVTEW